MLDFIFDIETGGLSFRDKFHCMGGIADPIDEPASDYFTWDRVEALNDLKKVLTNPDAILIGHNIIAYDLPYMLHNLLVPIECEIIDTLLLSRLCYPRLLEHGLEAWGKRLKIPKVVVSDLEFKEGTDKELLKRRCMRDVELTKLLYNNFYERKGDYIDKVMRKESSWIKHAVEMLSLGTPLNCARGLELYETYTNKANALKDKWAGTLDVGSTKQWGDYITNKYPTKDFPRTPTGAVAINKNTAREVKALAPETKDLFTQRKNVMMQGFFEPDLGSKRSNCIWKYTDKGLTGQVHLYPSFTYYGTRTYRGSYNSPCLNQFPRGEAREVIGLIGKQYKILGMDLQQLELAWMGYLLWKVCDNKTVWEQKEQGLSPKKLTIEAFPGGFTNVDDEEKEDRAKKLNYSWIYGLSDRGACLQLSLPTSEYNQDLARQAKERRFPSMEEYTAILESQIVNGVLRNYLGYAVKAYGEGKDYNIALNTQMQSTGDAYGRIYFGIFMDLLKKEDYRCRVILRNHDEIQVLVPMDFDESVMQELIRCTEKILERYCPVVTSVDYTFGTNWRQTH